MALKTPNAFARSRPSGKVTATSESAAGASSAANRPCRARAPSSMPVFTAAPPRAGAGGKPIKPVRKTRLRPHRSPRRPPAMSRPPKARLYAVITHCRLASENCRSAWACGRAMFTMVASRTTISWAMPMKANAFHRCGSGAGVVVPAGAEDMGELRFEKRGIRWGAAGRRPPNTVQGTRAPPAAAGPVVARTDRAPHPSCARPTVGSVDADQLRAEVRDFLIPRRGRIPPAEADLPVYGGLRRVSGLRREELAMLAGLSVEYYSRLERGNLRGVSDRDR